MPEAKKVTLTALKNIPVQMIDRKASGAGRIEKGKEFEATEEAAKILKEARYAK